MFALCDEITYHTLSKHLNVIVEFNPINAIEVAAMLASAAAITGTETLAVLISVSSCPGSAAGRVKVLPIK